MGYYNNDYKPESAVRAAKRPVTVKILYQKICPFPVLIKRVDTNNIKKCKVIIFRILDQELSYTLFTIIVFSKSLFKSKKCHKLA
ncbi:hypothetical protein GCM10009122_34260 [Fulvivirga kasyanovii]